MKIVLFNVKYSRNLGDGLIAECLEAAIHDHIPALVTSLDLAGRKDYGEDGVGARAVVLRIFDYLPAAVRRAVVQTYLRRFLKKQAPLWREALQDADLAIFGGGNLFQDTDLNFPLKIAGALKVTRSMHVPVVIYAVGVSPGWSAKAQRLFGEFRASPLRHVSLRDENSLQAWNKVLAGAHDPVLLCRDPGLLAASLLERTVRTQPPAKRAGIGLCITHPTLLRYHAQQGFAGRSSGARKFYCAIVERLLECGQSVVLFTNGAAEDQSFLEQVASDRRVQAGLSCGRVSVPAAACQPAELLALINGFQAIIAHRLHTNIAAYALGVPHVGLAWDVKVESFFRSMNRQAYFIRCGDDAPSRVADLALRACAEAIPEAERTAVAEQARAQIGAMLDHAGMMKAVDQGRIPLSLASGCR